jgi:hypothetical protein
VGREIGEQRNALSNAVKVVHVDGHLGFLRDRHDVEHAVGVCIVLVDHNTC